MKKLLLLIFGFSMITLSCKKDEQTPLEQLTGVWLLTQTHYGECVPDQDPWTHSPDKETHLTIKSNGIYEFDELGDVVETGNVSFYDSTITLCEEGKTNCHPNEYEIFEDQGVTFMYLYDSEIFNSGLNCKTKHIFKKVK
ncbi:MAG: hypothetical protein KAG37_07975 [Flavobacteriales bacterium]|nr:hypothetical protein [Flavobacteriales bacterium]